MGVTVPFKLSAEATMFLAALPARLVRWRGAWFLRTESGAYSELTDEQPRAWVRRACPDYTLSRSAVSNTLDEIAAALNVDHVDGEPPLWLDGEPASLPAVDLVAVQNGLLHATTGTLYAPTDSFFTLNALPFPHNPNAPTPERWLAFLGDFTGGDTEAIGELQKTTGLFVAGDTRLQKIFAVIGPKRSGKGTFARAITGLLGRANVASPSFNTLAGRFGLQGLIGKRLGIIPDARLGHSTDKILVAERLLSVSGEDAVAIERKGRVDYQGRLPTRFLILSNELPALPDPSGALASRYVVFSAPNSFYGREDHALDDALRGELPGILNWALEGWRRLVIGERIVTPANAREMLAEIDALGSPVKAFVAECCTFGPGLSVAKDSLWATYRGWHVSNGLPGAPLSKEMFGRNLKTALAGQVGDYHPNINGKRIRYWRGLAPTCSEPVPTVPSFSP